MMYNVIIHQFIRIGELKVILVGPKKVHGDFFFRKKKKKKKKILKKKKKSLKKMKNL